jgi:hypothetical protein
MKGPFCGPFDLSIISTPLAAEEHLAKGVRQAQTGFQVWFGLSGHG